MNFYHCCERTSTQNMKNIINYTLKGTCLYLKGLFYCPYILILKVYICEPNRYKSVPYEKIPTWVQLLYLYFWECRTQFKIPAQQHTRLIIVIGKIPENIVDNGYKELEKYREGGKRLSFPHTLTESSFCNYTACF